jgi:hypothetical protein
LDPLPIFGTKNPDPPTDLRLRLIAPTDPKNGGKMMLASICQLRGDGFAPLPRGAALRKAILPSGISPARPLFTAMGAVLPNVRAPITKGEWHFQINGA